MEVYTRAIEKGIIKSNCLQYSEKGPDLVVLSTGAGLMLSVCDILSERFSVYCDDLKGPVKKRSELIWTFSQFQTPLVCCLWLSLRPASDYLEILQQFETSAKNSIIYLKGLDNTDRKDWEDLGYIVVDSLEDLTTRALLTQK